jgi:hypothetical protein
MYCTSVVHHLLIESAIFEEPDLNELLPPPTVTTLLASSTSTRTSTDQPSLPVITSTKREPNNDLIVLDSVNEWSTMPTTTNNQQVTLVHLLSCEYLFADITNSE